MIMKMKNISKLVVAGLLSMPMLTACHDDDNVDLGSLTPESTHAERGRLVQGPWPAESEYIPLAAG